MLTIQPLGNQVVIKPLKTDEKTKSGILLPSKETKPEQGEVLAVGPGKRNEKGDRMAIDVKVGEKVIFKRYAPNEFEIDGEILYIIDADDIIATISA